MNDSWCAAQCGQQRIIPPATAACWHALNQVPPAAPPRVTLNPRPLSKSPGHPVKCSRRVAQDVVRNYEESATLLNSVAVDRSTRSPVSPSVDSDMPVGNPVIVRAALIGAFLSADPTAEGPLPAVARHCARLQGSASQPSTFPRPSLGKQRIVESSAANACAMSQATSAAVSVPEICQHKAKEVSQASPCAALYPRPSPSLDGSGPDAVPATTWVPSGTSPLLSPGLDPWAPYWLPESELALRGAVMDIVTVRAIS